MIKTRLVGLLSHAKKYIVYTILWQWLALLSQVIAVFCHCRAAGKSDLRFRYFRKCKTDSSYADPGCCNPLLL